MPEHGHAPVVFSGRECRACWAQLLGEAEVSLGSECVSRWVRPTTLVHFARGVATIEAPSAFHADYLDRNYAAQLLILMQRLGAPAARLQILVRGDARLASLSDQIDDEDDEEEETPMPPSSSGRSASGTRNQGDDGGLTSNALDPRFTFDSFVVGKPNELAHAAARRVAETMDVAYNPVFLYGGVGLGKTHLMHAIGWQLRASHPERKVLYLSAESFMFEFVRAMRFKDTHSFKQQFRSVDVLMIDDVQFIAGKDSTQEEFFHTFNALIDQNKQIVLSGDCSPERIDGMEERIKSRLSWGLVVDIHPADYELRLGILQAKAEAKLADEPHVDIDPKLYPFLAHRVPANIRVLEGALTRLFAFATLVRRRIDIEMAQECLADMLRNHEVKITLDEIKRKVADHYNLRISDLTSARRARNVARPRQVAMYLAKMLTQKSLPQIGAGFGGRDHTTVIHGIRKIESLIGTDARLREDVEILRRMLER